MLLIDRSSKIDYLLLEMFTFVCLVNSGFPRTSLALELDSRCDLLLVERIERETETTTETEGNEERTGPRVRDIIV